MWLSLNAEQSFGCLAKLSFILCLIAICETFEVKYGSKNYTKYEVGTSAVILTAGHGGLLEPSELSLRENGCYIQSKCTYDYKCAPKNAEKCKVTTVTDSYTVDITYAVAENLRKLGIVPHVIVNNIKRTYIDVNRPIDQACGGRTDCEKYYNEYHAFIREARKSFPGVLGLYFDIHGQKHSAAWTELGYRVSKSELNSGYYENVSSSIDHLRGRTKLPLKQLLAGNESFGSLLSNRGYKTVPSPMHEAPGKEGYYRGGYCTQIYGSVTKDGNCTDAIQIELPKVLRFGGDTVREELAKNLAETIKDFVISNDYGNPVWTCAASNLDINDNSVLVFVSVLLSAVYQSLIFLVSL